MAERQTERRRVIPVSRAVHWTAVAAVAIPLTVASGGAFMKLGAADEQLEAAGERLDTLEHDFGELSSDVSKVQNTVTRIEANQANEARTQQRILDAIERLDRRIDDRPE